MLKNNRSLSELRYPQKGFRGTSPQAGKQLFFQIPNRVLSFVALPSRIPHLLSMPPAPKHPQTVLT